ncbi:MAG: rod shape-determining protein MreC [Bacteroidales bacterium]|nr:MAG: rod shape-determining protein MreC [Bacteroidales bacterium]
MNSLLRFLEKYYFLLLFLILEGFSIWLLVDHNYYQKASFGKLSRGVISVIDNQIRSISNYFHFKQTNIEFMVENVALRNEMEKLKNRLEANKSNLTDSIGSVKYTYSTAKVVNNTINKQNNFITLNVGSNEGIQSEMGVITKDGIVGVVASVTKNFSTVISLLNTNLKVSAKHSRSGTFGSLYWDGVNYRETILSEIPQHVNLTQGDTIVTSGYSTIFPPNIPLGIIEEFELKDGSFYIVKVKLLSDFKRINNVYVIKSHQAAEKNLIEKQNE